MERIYLGFLGEEKLRLGESLIIIKRTYNNFKLFVSMNNEKLYKYLSNVYLMYNVQRVENIFSILSISSDKMFFVFPDSDYSKKRKKILKNVDELDMKYCISFKLFSFLSERLWPAIIKAFINSLGRYDNYFYFQMEISKKQIMNLLECENEECALINFKEQFNNWLDFHILGNIESYEKKGENNYQFKLKIIY